MHLMAFGTKTKKKAYLWIISALQAFSSFEYLFFVFMDITFLYYISEGRDDVISGSTKTVQHSVTSLTNISRNITLVLFKLGTRTVTHTQKKTTADFFAFFDCNDIFFSFKHAIY